VPGSPLDPHGSSPRELRDRLLAEAAGGALLVYRDGDDRQMLVRLADAPGRVTIGRGGADVSLDWDARVSRIHAAIERLADAWVVADDGLSRNGTLVNGQRIDGRRRLADGDVIVVGQTALAFSEAGSPAAGATLTAERAAAVEPLTPAQRRVLVALCRPYRHGGFATPASNPEIAAELVVSVEAVRTTMRALFDRFGIEDLPQNRKRAALAEQALRTGAIARADLQ
jgi:hypothetical protein